MAKKDNRLQQEAAENAQAQQKAKQLMRRRLLGALALFAATFLLWELGGTLPPQPLVRAVPPPQGLFSPQEEEAQPASAVIPDMQALLPYAEEEEQDAPVFQVIAEAEEAPPPASEAEAESAQQTAVAAVTAKAETEAPAATTIAAAAPEPQPQPAAQKTETPTAATAADSAAAVAGATAAVDVYHVQIGAFRRQAHAQSVVATLEVQGFIAAVLPLAKQDGTLWRVRAVSYPTRAAAQAAQAALVAHGYAEAQVVAAEPIPPQQAAAPAPYRLRVGVYREAAHAQAAAAAIKKAGARPAMQTLEKDGVQLTRVLAAGLPSEAAAKQLQETLRAAGYADTVIEAAQ